MKNSRTVARVPAPSKVDRRAPRRLALGVEELRRVALQVVALRSEVVVDDVEQHREPARVRRVDQRASGPRARRTTRRGANRQHAVVAPVAPAREIRHRHQLDRGHAQRRPARRAARRAARERALGGEACRRAVRRSPPRPTGARASAASRHAKRRGIDRPRSAACTSSGLKRDAGIRHAMPVVEHEAVARSPADAAAGHSCVPARARPRAIGRGARLRFAA